DEDAPQRHAAYERCGAIDRVDDPAPAAAAGGLRKLLAGDPVLRERGGKLGADRLLRAAVGDRHRARVGLVLDRELRVAVVLQRELTGAGGGATCDVELALPARGHARAGSVAVAGRR